MEFEKADEVLEKFEFDKSALISILYEIQLAYGYLDQEVLKRVSENLQISMNQLFSVVTFYKIFRLKPCGKHVIHVCTGTACHVRGSFNILEEFERTLKIKSGETTDDLMFTLEKVNCLGCCALGPVVLVNDEYHGQMTTAKVTSLIKRLRSTNED